MKLERFRGTKPVAAAGAIAPVFAALVARLSSLEIDPRVVPRTRALTPNLAVTR